MLYKLYKNQIKPNRLVLFFAGFASSPDDFSHLKLSDKFDLAIIYNYTNISGLDEIQKLADNYADVEILGFSMGVAIASRLDIKKAKLKLAICGTSLGIDKTKGIREAIFKQSIKNFDANSFAANIGIKSLHQKPAQEHKQELKSIFDFCTSTPPLKSDWQKFIAASKDSIFSLKAMQEEGQQRLKILEQMHFLFYAFSSWEELCAI